MDDVNVQYERMLAAAFRRLVKMDRLDAALPLLDARITSIHIPPKHIFAQLDLLLGAEAFDAYRAADYVSIEGWDPVREASYPDKAFGSLYRDVFNTVVSHEVQVGEVVPRVRLDPVEAGWREAAYAMLEGGDTNQGNLVSNGAITYNGRFYRSPDETLIARELDARGILYFPLPTASRGGMLREPDIVVVVEGRIGIIEVDGAHQAGRAAGDHERDQFFEQSGVVVQHVSGDDIRASVTSVVDAFIRLLTGAPR